MCPGAEVTSAHGRQARRGAFELRMRAAAKAHSIGVRLQRHCEELDEDAATASLSQSAAIVSRAFEVKVVDSVKRPAEAEVFGQPIASSSGGSARS